ncbi:hypothetical protein GCM10022226_61330 [Sphaerisporangium flaviroseum]|uniref:CdiI immunity protein domain-containing protein n=2 Tax=Sphaerisporangium flaviroseum TaxID=509199 RepID=A0ABP7J0P8_9ACTN
MLSEIVPLLRKYPGMFGLDNTFSSMAAFLRGFDVGTDHQALDGFCEMLADKIGDGANMSWEYLVLRLAFPDNSQLWDKNRSRENNEEGLANDLLFDLLHEFIDSRVQ